MTQSVVAAKQINTRQKAKPTSYLINNGTKVARTKVDAKETKIAI
jgi:hypothetical protein